MDSFIAKIYQSPKTILTTKDLTLLLKEKSKSNLNSKIAYYKKRGILIGLSRGIFAKENHYDLKELATSVYLPSYISFETALREQGIIFQHYETIFVASKWSRIVRINNHTFNFRKVKDIVLYNPAGILIKNNYSIAGPERAFLDTIYLFKNYHFDNLRPLDWDLCFNLAKIYKNKQLIKRLANYRQRYA